MSQADIEAVHEDLMQRGALTPVELGGADERLWLDCDLASLAENRLGDKADPRDIDDARRAHWHERATDEREASLRSRGSYERSYWLLEGGQRVGTMALATATLGGRALRLSSFYVLPPFRGSGAGRRALDRLKEALAQRGLGLRLETSWCWQRAVRFYLAAGMWVYMWKRDLTFYWDPDLPRASVDVGESEATLSVSVDGERIVLASARRHDRSLELADARQEIAKDKRLGDAYWHASSTLSLVLALRGWPLVRSKEDWDESYYADGGAPESLAYKITIWEAWAKDRDWIVDTPRIPGVEYPTWSELEARWAKEREEFEASLSKQERD